MIVGVTGHRPSKLGGYDDSTNKSSIIKEKLIQFLIELKPSKVVSGMALGADQWFVEVALQLHIPVIALIPCLGQDNLWSDNQRLKYLNLLLEIETNEGEVIYVSKEKYRPELMQKRNEEIVRLSDLIIAIWDGSKGGTYNCVLSAEKSNKSIIRIDPKCLTQDLK